MTKGKEIRLFPLRKSRLFGIKNNWLEYACSISCYILRRKVNEYKWGHRSSSDLSRSEIIIRKLTEFDFMSINDSIRTWNIPTFYFLMFRRCNRYHFKIKKMASSSYLTVKSWSLTPKGKRKSYQAVYRFHFSHYLSLIATFSSK